MHKITGRAFPSIAAIQTEAARIEAMIVAATQQIESSDAHLRTAMHLQVCRAELHAYLAGLLYSMGYTNLLERQNAIEQVTLLAQRYGIALGKAEERLSVVKAETGLAETLDVAARSPVVVLDRVIFTLDGRAAEWRVAYCSIASECAAAMMH